MKKFIIVAICATFLISCNQNKQSTSHEKGFSSIEQNEMKLNYPDAYKDSSVVDDYFGTKVADPYRWLEDDHSKETEAWVNEENTITNNYLAKISFRQQVRNRLERLYDYTRFSTPFQEGENYFYFKNNGLQNQSVLYITDDLEQEGNVFLDPNKLSNDGTVALGSISVNSDGTLFGYSISKSGSDWQTIKVKTVDSQKDLEDEVEWAKFTGIDWAGDGFYYGTYPKPKEGEEFSSANEHMKIKYHKIGTSQEEDVVIYEDTTNPKKYFDAKVTEDERFLIIGGSLGTSGNDLIIKDLSKPDSEFITAKTSLDTDAHVIGNVGEEIFVLTNENSPNWRLVSFNINTPTDWKDVIKEKEHFLASVSQAGGYFFAKYIEDVKHKMYQYSYDGSLVHKIELPGQGTVSGFGGKDDAKDLYFNFTTITQPSSIYKYNIESQNVELFRAPDVDFSSEDYTTEQVFYSSKDGTKVPMYIVYKKGLERTGDTPTILYGYGGFDISIMPNFNPVNIAWLEQGGIYAVANIRGGSEYGAKWHDGGRLLNKQNVFDDFIAAAEYLIQNKYTSTEKLAVEGRSNGGLLIGAVMTQRPDLFGVCLPTVGVLDMLRYEKFTIGHAWASDYGSVEEEQHFKNLYSYSPLHNIKEGVEYPATMVVTADHDDRVFPAHSFKFAATLQEKQAGDEPILIRIDKESGHGSGKPVSKILDEWADIFSFTMYNLGVEPIY